MIVRKSAAELEAMREGGRVTAACLEMLEENVRLGLVLVTHGRLAEEFIYERGGKPEFKGYQGFPASICASPNAMIVHGIPGSYALADGDIVSVDVGVTLGVLVADSAWTLDRARHTPYRRAPLLEFEDRGEHELKGIEGARRVFAAV